MEMPQATATGCAKALMQQIWLRDGSECTTINSHARIFGLKMGGVRRVQADPLTAQLLSNDRESLFGVLYPLQQGRITQGAI